jgi:hypothetical protein
MKGISKAAHAGLSPLIAVLAPTEVLTQAALGFIPPPIKPSRTPWAPTRLGGSICSVPGRLPSLERVADLPRDESGFSAKIVRMLAGSVST